MHTEKDITKTRAYKFLKGLGIKMEPPYSGGPNRLGVYHSFWIFDNGYVHNNTFGKIRKQAIHTFSGYFAYVDKESALNEFNQWSNNNGYTIYKHTETEYRADDSSGRYIACLENQKFCYVGLDEIDKLAIEIGKFKGVDYTSDEGEGIVHTETLFEGYEDHVRFLKGLGIGVILDDNDAFEIQKPIWSIIINSEFFREFSEIVGPTTNGRVLTDDYSGENIIIYVSKEDALSDIEQYKKLSNDDLHWTDPLTNPIGSFAFPANQSNHEIGILSCEEYTLNRDELEWFVNKLREKHQIEVDSDEDHGIRAIGSVFENKEIEKAIKDLRTIGKKIDNKGQSKGEYSLLVYSIMSTNYETSKLLKELVDEMDPLVIRFSIEENQIIGFCLAHREEFESLVRELKERLGEAISVPVSNITGGMEGIVTKGPDGKFNRTKYWYHPGAWGTYTEDEVLKYVEEAYRRAGIERGSLDSGGLDAIQTILEERNDDFWEAVKFIKTIEKVEVFTDLTIDLAPHVVYAQEGEPRILLSNIIKKVKPIVVYHNTNVGKYYIASFETEKVILIENLIAELEQVAKVNKVGEITQFSGSFGLGIMFYSMHNNFISLKRDEVIKYAKKLKSIMNIDTPDETDGIVNAHTLFEEEIKELPKEPEDSEEFKNALSFIKSSGFSVKINQKSYEISRAETMVHLDIHSHGLPFNFIPGPNAIKRFNHRSDSYVYLRHQDIIEDINNWEEKNPQLNIVHTSPESISVYDKGTFNDVCSVYPVGSVSVDKQGILNFAKVAAKTIEIEPESDDYFGQSTIGRVFETEEQPKLSKSEVEHASKALNAMGIKNQLTSNAYLDHAEGDIYTFEGKYKMIVYVNNYKETLETFSVFLNDHKIFPLKVEENHCYFINHRTIERVGNILSKQLGFELKSYNEYWLNGHRIFALFAYPSSSLMLSSRELIKAYHNALESLDITGDHADGMINTSTLLEDEFPTFNNFISGTSQS